MCERKENKHPEKKQAGYDVMEHVIGDVEEGWQDRVERDWGGLAGRQMFHHNPRI